MAQGIANCGSALFGGLPATGAIARTATNVRAGARSPLAGILHAAFLLAFMLVAAPLMGDVPLGTLRSASLSLRGGGVGYYPKSNFVHVDTGRVRAW